MFILIHGEDQAKTRQELINLVSKAKSSGITDIAMLDGKTISLEILIQNLESLSLLGPMERLTIIEDLHRRRSKTELKEFVDYISKQDKNSLNLIMWEGQELTATQLKKIPDAKIVTAKLSLVLFKLTDALTPNADISTILKLYQSAVTTDSPEMILIMLARQLRMMIQTFDPGNKLPPWQKGKLVAPAKAFGLEKLIAMHHQLCEIDVANKTGKLPVDLKSELQQWLISTYIS